MTNIIWGPMIVLYSFITGLVLGSYIISIAPILFKVRNLEGISTFSMVTAWGFLLASPIPLVLELGSPLRAPNIYLYPMPSSVMALFGYIWMIFVILLTTQIIVHSRYREAVWFQRASTGISAIGLVISLIFGGYFGFIIGGMKAREVWSSTITPITAILSGITAGAALVTLLAIITLGRDGLRKDTLNSLGKLTLYFLVIYLVFTLIELSITAYAETLIWTKLSILLFGYLALSFIGVQYILGGLLPIFMLVTEKVRTSTIGSIATSILILAGVYSYKWNLIIGGQQIVEVSPQLYSLLSFMPTQTEILATVGVISLSLFLYVLGLTIFPIPEFKYKR
ncbi:MAG: NrfD/PsrC family molybdoenzyme membrane anchor subunit [Nitrososphaerota archaeon]|nr:polysulfide reductase NrfD [Candidatus Geocrenenecus dongiae]